MLLEVVRAIVDIEICNSLIIKELYWIDSNMERNWHAICE